MAAASPNEFLGAQHDEADDSMLSMLLLGLCSGDDAAYAEFWRRYGERMRALARSHLPLRLQNRLEADDVVQSACRSFFRRATGGEFTLNDSESLRRLLCAITLNKMRMQIRFHSRQRRSPLREVSLENPANDSATPAIQPEATTATPSELAMFVEQLELLMSALDAEERRIVELKLQDFSTEEIAAQLTCSDRTVRRLLKRIRDRWQSLQPEFVDGESTPQQGKRENPIRDS